MAEQGWSLTKEFSHLNLHDENVLSLLLAAIAILSFLWPIHLCLDLFVTLVCRVGRDSPSYVDGKQPPLAK
jgi:hypothetical protein